MRTDDVQRSPADERRASPASGAPSIQLPKGGGAIRGIGEKFAVSSVTGTGSSSVPIATSPGRSGFGPELSVSYDSGAGNGPFGFGWGLSLPSITRKTDQGLPRYEQAGEPDVFVLSGAEDLVPVLVPGTPDWVREAPVVRTVGGTGYRVARFRPRLEGLFARIECWTNTTDPAEVFWRTVSGDNVTTWFGRTAESRIADPADPRRIFSWLICQSHDDRGNVVVYGYKPEDSARIFEDAAGNRLVKTHERHRTPVSRAAQRYLKRIRYGNRLPYHPVLGDETPWPEPPDASAPDAGDAWHFEVVFDYGEHDEHAPEPGDTGLWPVRQDPFSSYRAGFEVRTMRLCRRVLMFHHFPDQAGVGRGCLVRSTDFTYSDEVDPADARNPVYAFLNSIGQFGYRRRDGGYDRRGLPPVEFEYARPVVQDTVQEVAAPDLDNLPMGLDGSVYRWADLHGEGIPGILTEQAGAWFYKRNLSPSADGPSARFAPLETVARKPNASLRGGAELLDLAGDGLPDVVVMAGATPGLYEHDDAEGWGPLRPFASRLTRDLRDPNVKFVDLDGDGRTDVLVAQADSLVWHAGLGEDGFGPAQPGAGPRVVFADATRSTHVADLSGDGLPDLVRIRNGEVCYWPNLGYGRFGAKVTMDDAPWFDHPDQFDPRRLRLADIDGSGTTDLIYLHRDGVRLYFNQSGNGWSRPHQLAAFPHVADVAGIAPVDLLGNGTTCLVWSSPWPGDRRRPLRYVNLMGRKPHLLTGMRNNLGAQTRIVYAPSTKFYLQDRREGRPWITRLPFPTHVVERVETYDHVSRNRFVTRYAYHHGYFDGAEREFRGFGMVEQWDTAEFAALADGAVPATNVDVASHVPPVHTKTWYHTGGERTADYRREYFREPGLTDEQADALLLPDTALPDGLTDRQRRQACRALKGTMVRQEVYADDADSLPPASPDAAGRARRAATPYTVVEQNFTVRTVQPPGPDQHGVFLAHPRESISYHYERNPADPRVQHALTLEVDDFGNVLKQADIGYGRRTQIRVVDESGLVRTEPNPGLAELPLADRAKQTTAAVVYSQYRVTNAVDSPAARRNPVVCESRVFELTGYPATGPAGRYRASDLVEPDPAAPGRLRHRFAAEVAYEQTASGSLRRRPIEWLRTLLRRDDLSGLLPLGELQALGLPGESYQAAFTPGLLAQAYRRPRSGGADENLLPAAATVLEDGGYVSSQKLQAGGNFPAGDADGHWWLPSGRQFYSTAAADAGTELVQARRHFFQLRRHRDAFGQDTTVTLDPHDLMIAATVDPIGNRVTVEAHDYRVLEPCLVSDPNGNRTEVAFDILGLVAGTAVMGKALPAPAEGDTLAGFVTDLTQAQFDGFFAAADPHAGAAALLGGATMRIVYDLDRFRRTGAPACAATLTRETHASAALPPHGLRIQIGYSYSDGFAREIQKKAQAEPGPDLAPRWVGSGWTVFNNKGNPVRQFEPFFSTTQHFEFGLTAGVSPVLFYDPAQRVIVTLHPNHTYEKVVFDPWRQTSHDVNDTCAADPRTDPDVAGFVAAYFDAQPGPWQTWHAQRVGGALGPDEQTAAQRAQAHAGTPSTAHFDVLGRPFSTVTRNRVVCPGHDLDGQERSLTARVELDVEGNQREVRDTLDRVVARYVYDMLGNRIHQLSMEAGARWMLADADGRPVRAWDSRGHTFTTTYDALRRPVEKIVRGSTVESDPRTLDRDVVFERAEYGDAVPDAAARNLRGRIHRQFDPAGVATSDLYDFKGNLLRSTRRLTSDHAALPDWVGDPALQDETFQTSSRYDALNRPVQAVAPHSSVAGAARHVMQPVFNAASLLERVDVWLERAADPDAPLDPAAQPPSPVGVAGVDYDAMGRRVRIDYKNGAGTSYTYDPLTFRLTRLQTTRDGTALQDLRYTYDPAGNTVRIRDDAQQEVFFRNRRVEPGNDYVYDALYRLIQAGGREHLGQGGAPAAHSPADAGRVGLAHPGDGNAMGAYLERYVYDGAANFLRTQHRGSDPAHAGWTRHYDYLEPSLIDPTASSNRLSSTRIDPNGTEPPRVEPCRYDAHGNVIRLAHLGGGQPGPNMHWDHLDQLHRVDLGGGGTAHYVYDASGRRARKVWEKAPGLVEERIYLGGFEVFRKHTGPIGAGTAKLERETLHVMDDKQRIALVETRTRDTAGDDPAPRQQIRYQFGNHLASAGLELDDQAKIISYEEYSPYGSSTYQAVRSHTETGKRYRYTGKERDEESGLYYHGARYYACWQGRWMSCDPQGLADGFNVYAYVGANPVAMSDPTGTNGKPGANIADVADDAIELLDGPDPWKPDGKAGDVPITMDIDEPKPVGEKGISPAESRARALDPSNRQFLDPKTNRRTKYLGIDSHAPAGAGKGPVSVTTDPDALLTRNFDQITEMREIFDQAARGYQKSGLKGTKLKAAINHRIWEIIKTGKGDAAVKVREALAKLGFTNVKGKGYVMQGASPTKPQPAPEAPAPVPEAPPPPPKAAAPAPKAPAPKAPAPAPKPALIAKAPAPTPKAPAPAPKTPTPKGGGVSGGTVVVGVLWAYNLYCAWESYKDGTRPNTPAPVGDGMIGGSQGEGILNGVGTLAGAPGVGTALRQAAEAGSTGSKPEKVWNAIKSGIASPTSIGMGMFFGAFK